MKLDFPHLFLQPQKPHSIIRSLKFACRPSSFVKLAQVSFWFKPATAGGPGAFRHPHPAKPSPDNLTTETKRTQSFSNSSL